MNIKQVLKMIGYVLGAIVSTIVAVYLLNSDMPVLSLLGATLLILTFAKTIQTIFITLFNKISNI